MHAHRFMRRRADERLPFLRNMRLRIYFYSSYSRCDDWTGNKKSKELSGIRPRRSLRTTRVCGHRYSAPNADLRIVLNSKNVLLCKDNKMTPMTSGQTTIRLVIGTASFAPLLKRLFTELDLRNLMATQFENYIWTSYRNERITVVEYFRPTALVNTTF